MVSLIIVTLFASLFGSLALRTARKQIINSSANHVNEIDPSALKMTMGPGDFMFGVMINQLDLNASPRLFDVNITQEFYSTGFSLLNSTSIPLVQCTDQHFAFNQDLQSINTRFPTSSALCPQLGQELTVKGKFSSTLYAQVKVTVSRCTGTNSRNQTCANST